MKLREYEYMLAIAQEANMTRAAQRLYISQPALSKLLASVESELGVQLFRQENRRMIPTAAGKTYLENAEKILSLNHDMERTVRLASSPSELTLAYPLIYSGFITGSVLPAMCRINPSVSVHILHSAQSKILDHILHGHFLSPSALLPIPFGNPLRLSTSASRKWFWPSIKGIHSKHKPFYVPIAPIHIFQRKPFQTFLFLCLLQLHSAAISPSIIFISTSFTLLSFYPPR